MASGVMAVTGLRQKPNHLKPQGHWRKTLRMDARDRCSPSRCPFLRNQSESQEQGGFAAGKLRDRGYWNTAAAFPSLSRPDHPRPQVPSLAPFSLASTPVTPATATEEKCTESEYAKYVLQPQITGYDHLFPQSHLETQLSLRFTPSTS